MNPWWESALLVLIFFLLAAGCVYGIVSAIVGAI